MKSTVAPKAWNVKIFFGRDKNKFLAVIFYFWKIFIIINKIENADNSPLN